jgi:hypothetical protein
MVVSNANFLSAFMSADSDYGPDYGKITILEVPGKSVIQGPAQVANVFKSNSVISKDISLLNSGQSEVIHGNLLTLPLGDSFLYVEPLYVQATGGASYPTLQRILVTYGDKIGYGATLDNALKDITSGRATGASVTVGETTTGSSTTTPTPTTPPPSGGSSTPTSPSSNSTTPSSPSTHTAPPPTTGKGRAKLEAQLNQAYTEYDQAQRAGDQEAVGVALGKILSVLAQLNALNSPSTGASPSG